MIRPWGPHSYAQGRIPGRTFAVADWLGPGQPGASAGRSLGEEPLLKASPPPCRHPLAVPSACPHHPPLLCPSRVARLMFRSFALRLLGVGSLPQCGSPRPQRPSPLYHFVHRMPGRAPQPRAAWLHLLVPVTSLGVIFGDSQPTWCQRSVAAQIILEDSPVL